MSKLYLAPMVRGSFPATRTLALEHGADMAYTDVVMALALIDAKRTVEDGKVCFERPNYRVLTLQICESSRTVVQIAGDSAYVLNYAAALVMPFCACVDLNLGCGKHFTAYCNTGGVLAQDFSRLGQIIEHLSPEIIWSAKTRLFYSAEQTVRHLRLLFGKCVRVAVHARFFYDERERDPARLDVFLSAMAELTEADRARIIYNGDINSYEQYAQLQSHAAALGFASFDVMIARGALANIYVFEQIKARSNASLDINYYAFSSIAEAAEQNKDRFCDAKALILFGLKHVKTLARCNAEIRARAVTDIQTIAHYGTFEQLRAYLAQQAQTQKK